MSDMLRMMQVHAHPDDEASKGSGTNARYATQGVETSLVTCTGGEAGDILNQALDTDEVKANLAEIRKKELAESVRILGYRHTHLLGYRDSGMPDSDHNKHPDAFANADFDEAVGRLVEIVRRDKPHVILTYGDDHSGYPHPDHIRCHEITVAAFDAAADTARYPGEPWQPKKLYYMGWTARRIRAMHQWLVDQGRESWFEKRLDSLDDAADERFTTRIDVRRFMGARSDSLRAHATQVAPDSFWFAIPDEVLAEIYPYEEYVCARSLVDIARDSDGFETDLFSGVR